MKATTIKIEGNLLREIEVARPSSKSLTAFVREVLSQDLKRRRITEAATRYESFLSSHPDEREWLSHWETADLGRPVRKKNRRSS